MLRSAYACLAADCLLLAAALWQLEVLTRFARAAAAANARCSSAERAGTAAAFAAFAAHGVWTASLLAGDGDHFTAATSAVACAAYLFLALSEHCGRRVMPLLQLTEVLIAVDACVALSIAAAVAEGLHWGGDVGDVAAVAAFASAGLYAAFALLRAAFRHCSNGSSAVADAGSVQDSAPLLLSTAATVRALHAASPAEDRAGFGSRITFAWATAVMRRGSERFLQHSDLLEVLGLPVDLDTADLTEKFARQLRGAIALADGPGWRRRAFRPLLNALLSEFGGVYLPLGFLKLLADVAGFAQPILLHRFISELDDKNGSAAEVMKTAGLLSLVALTQSILNSQYGYQCVRVQVAARGAVVTSVYSKAIRVSFGQRFSTGEVVNMMSTDCDRVANFCPSFHQFWSLPFQIAVSLYLLHRQVGVSFLAGLSFCIVLIPLNRWIAGQIGELSKDMMAQKDSRVRVMGELLHGIRVVKQYAWEEHFADKVRGIREAELKSLKGRKYLDAWCVYFWATTPIVISILTFMTYSLLGNDLTAATVFTSMALFNMLIGPLNSFPWVLNGLVEALVSLRRVDEFLRAGDVGSLASAAPAEDADGIRVRNGRFSWGGDGPAALSNLSIRVAKGELVCVSGDVAAGKTSLLMAILGEMAAEEGEVQLARAALDRGIGYVSQEGWIQNTTIRENILFGSPLDEDFYGEVLSSCALDGDMRQFANGDLTEVGENGTTLSGGQRARITLARAVYQRKAVYLLDDPTAALDQRVAAHIFENCILGLLGGSTRLLCTHSHDILKAAPRVLSVSREGVTEVHAEGGKSSLETSKKAPAAGTAELADTGGGGLVKEEERSVGTVSIGVYGSYWRSVGTALAVSVLVALALMQGSKNSTDWWLSYWVRTSKDGESGYCGTTKCYLTVYACFAGANSVFALFRAFLFAYAGIRAARRTHERLLDSVLYTTVQFFDATPVGRVLNRFSSDVYGVDDTLPFIMNIFLMNVFGLVGSVALTMYGLPYFGFVMIPVSCIYYTIQRYYRMSSREIKRLSNISRSPIYAHFSETLTGVVTVRALQAGARFESENVSKLHTNQIAAFAEQVVNQWLGFRLYMIGALFVASVSSLAGLQYADVIPGSVDPGLVGLSLTYALSVTGLLGGLVTSFTETEKEMVAVERQEQYIALPEEPGRKDGGGGPERWPSAGGLSFKDVTMSYAPDAPPALKGVSFELPPGTKMGVVGRTGAGKSSLLRALFRMTPLSGGSISIDGVDLASVPLRCLRQRLAVIPQEPVLFCGTIRENLDPFGQHSDEAVWEALERCQLKATVLRAPLGLQQEVHERGKNFSVGQRQLCCLGRALLKRSRVIAVDEATASVDLRTDALVQQTIRTEFADSTVITIAHRVSTVADADLVVVMEAGTAIEVGPPDHLRSIPGSRFAGYCNPRPAADDPPTDSKRRHM